MKKESYHTHSTVSDGELSPKELIECAIENGFETLAITDHYPRPDGIGTGWSQSFYSDEDYQNLRKLKEEYSGKINVLIGAEFEWLPNKIDWLSKQISKREYDIKIISVHQIFLDDKYYTINYTDEAFREPLDLLGGDIKKMIKIYYQSIRDAVKSKWFDIVGHLDVIKTLNSDSKYFSEDESWYREEVMKTLEAIKESGMKMEVNFQGLIRACACQWPSGWIIKEVKKMGIKLVVGTDAHSGSELSLDWNNVEKVMNES